MKIYTGIGSRATPEKTIKQIKEISSALSKRGWLLRSGGAEGADQAFESASLRKRIYLPWNGFNGKYADNTSYIVPKYEPEYVWDYHPNPYRLSQGALKLMSRNTYQVLGDYLSNPLPSDMLICYTSDGKASGGTGQALRIASSFNIPIYNLFYEKDYERLKDFISEN